MKYLLAFLMLPVFVFAQQDTIKNYNLEEITVKSGIVIEPKTITELKYRDIQKSDAGSLSELGKYVPSIKVQTNSRGETLFYLRGSGERQISLFFDGVPLNIPWDNRIDLSLVPTNAIKDISVTKGIPSIVYGANSPAGVVNINSENLYSGQSKKVINMTGGIDGYKKFSGYAAQGFDKINYLLSVSYKERNDFTLPSSYDNPENTEDTRINSAINSLSTFAKLNYKYGKSSEAGLSFSFIDSEKDVPPETNVASPRYWKYPLWRKYTTIFNGKNVLNDNNSTLLTYTASVTKFNMQIDQYTDDSFSEYDDIEKDEDIIYFGRIILTQFVKEHSLLKFSASGYTTTHKEKFLSSNYEEQTYVQNLYSIGGEYEYKKGKFMGIAGISLDGTSTPETGDKTSKEPVTDYGLNFAGVYSFNNKLSANINFGRKTRFPTLRETFSGALGRFVPNPDLKAEVVYSAEAGGTYLFGNGSLTGNFFYNILEDGIVRQSLPGSQFQRINKDKIRTYGIELIAGKDFNEKFTAGVNLTAMTTAAKNSEGEFSDTLEYKPQFIISVTLDYTPFQNFNSMLEFFYEGKQFGLQEGNLYFQKLPDVLLINLRAAYTLEFNNFDITAFARVNNIFDRLYYSKWGLPEPGREFFTGISAEF